MAVINTTWCEACGCLVHPETDLSDIVHQRDDHTFIANANTVLQDIAATNGVRRQQTLARMREARDG